METFERELKRGTLELMILRLLADGRTYGYELIRRLTERSGGLFRLKEGTLYPVLYRLEDAGWIVAEWDPPARGVPRKYYHLTPQGRQRLRELTQAWESFSATVNTILNPDAAAKEDA